MGCPLIIFGRCENNFYKFNNAWKEAGWDAPLLENDLVTDEVKLTLFVPRGDSQKMVKPEMKLVLQLIKEAVVSSQRSYRIIPLGICLLSKTKSALTSKMGVTQKPPLI